MKDYIVSVFKKFVPISGTSIPVGDNIEETVGELLANPNFICICEEGKGVIIGIVYPVFWNTKVLSAQELGFWVEPAYRKTGLALSLLRSFEKTVKELGAEEITMIALESSNPDIVGRMYEKLGYTKLEHTYMKRV